MSDPLDPSAVVERLYKTESARLLSVLVRLFGPKNLELAEDVLQDAFQRALLSWQRTGLPDSPAAWIMRAARNQAIDVIRKRRTHDRFSDDLRFHLESDWTLGYAVDREFSEPRIKDDQLRMIFMCASAGITPENRIPLLLRTLCGFSVPAIAKALFLPEDTVKKRLLRTREKLRGHLFELPSVEELPPAMDTVHTVIYLLFNEGFYCSEKDRPLRHDLCLEALHLGSLLAEEPRIVNRDTLGLLALMHFHLARASSRLDEQGQNVPIDLQDRSTWDGEEIDAGRELLKMARFAPPGASERFYWEAAIALEHCRAKHFSSTNWQAIVALYEQLVACTQSPVARLNQAVALAYSGNIEAAFTEVSAVQEHTALSDSHLPSAILAHLFAMQGNVEQAHFHAERSARLGGSVSEQSVMRAQIERLLGAASPD